MFNRYTCRIEKEEFIDNSLSSLSPFLDLPSYVEAEKKCESNIYDRGETKKMRDVDVLHRFGKVDASMGALYIRLSIWNRCHG